MDKKDPAAAVAVSDYPQGCTTDHGNEVGEVSNSEDTHLVYNGFVTFENGLSVDGPRAEATVCFDKATNTITVSLKKPVSVFVAPDYPIVIEFPQKEDKTD